MSHYYDLDAILAEEEVRQCAGRRALLPPLCVWHT